MPRKTVFAGPVSQAVVTAKFHEQRSTGKTDRDTIFRLRLGGGPRPPRQLHRSHRPASRRRPAPRPAARCSLGRARRRTRHWCRSGNSSLLSTLPCSATGATAGSGTNVTACGLPTDTQTSSRPPTVTGESATSTGPSSTVTHRHRRLPVWVRQESPRETCHRPPIPGRLRIGRHTADHCRTSRRHPRRHSNRPSPPAAVPSLSTTKTPSAPIPSFGRRSPGLRPDRSVHRAFEHDEVVAQPLHLHELHAGSSVRRAGPLGRPRRDRPTNRPI